MTKKTRLKYAAEILRGGRLLFDDERDGTRGDGSGTAGTRRADERGTVPVWGARGLVGTHSAGNTEGAAIMISPVSGGLAMRWLDAPAYVDDTASYIDARSTDHDLRYLFHAMTLTASLREDAREGVFTGTMGELKGMPIASFGRDAEAAIAARLDAMDEHAADFSARVDEARRLLHDRRRALALETMGILAVDDEAPPGPGLF